MSRLLRTTRSSIGSLLRFALLFCAPLVLAARVMGADFSVTENACQHPSIPTAEITACAGITGYPNYWYYYGHFEKKCCAETVCTDGDGVWSHMQYEGYEAYALNTPPTLICYDSIDNDPLYVCCGHYTGG